MNKKVLQGMGLTALFIVSAQAIAEDSQFYIGGAYGQARGQVGASEMNKRMASLGYDAEAKVSGQNRSAWDVFGGYRVSDYFSVEAEYVDLGEVRTRLSGSPVDIHDYLNSANLVHPRSADGYELAVVARYPFDEKNSVYLRGGVLFASSRYRADAQTDFAKRSDSDQQGFIGVGYGYEINDRWGLQLSYENYNVEDERIGLFGLGIKYKFSTRKEVKPVLASTPVEVAAPIIKPVVVEEKPAPVLSVKLAVQFDTNSAKVKSNYVADIVKVADYLKEHPSAKLNIHGHTDDQGDNQFNKKLSLERALAVKNLLVEKYNIQGDRITAKGFGEEQPIASNATAEGRAANRRIMAEIVN